MRRLLPSILILAAAAHSAEGDAVDFKYMYYWDRNGVWNHTPAVAFLKRLGSAWGFRWEQEADYVSGASRRLGLRNIGRQGDNAAGLDAVSGASRRELRNGAKAALSYERGGRAASASLYHSREDDYFSWSPALKGSWDFNDRNTTLGGEAALFLDEMAPRGAFRGLGGDRTIASGAISLTQILSRWTVATATLNGIHSEGYLGHPYNPVILDVGGLLPENLPGDKTGYALAAKIIQGYKLGSRLGSARLEGRYYRDSWRLSSHTLEFQVYQYVAGASWVRLRARGYRQEAAGFYKEAYDGGELYRTADLRYSAFSSLILGAKFGSDCFLGWQATAWLPDRWDIGYDHGMRDTRGDEGADPPYRHYQLFPRDERYLQGTFMLGLGFDL